MKKLSIADTDVDEAVYCWYTGVDKEAVYY